MLRGVLLVAAFGLGLGFSFAADPKPDDLAALQGNWKPLQCEFEGKPQMPVELMKQVTGVYDKAEYYLYFVDTKGKNANGKPDVMLLALANVTLDPTTNPKSITFEFADGPLKGVKRHGIYELAGNQLKLCVGPSERPRPNVFKSTVENGYFLETWARQAK
jgi:uncharacterized protein (TIGR03067 family)